MVTNVVESEMNSNYIDIFMKSVETGSFFMLIISIIQIVIQIFVWYLVIKTFIKAYKRTKSHTNFKNNVIPKEEKRDYKDVSKSKLSMFNTDDINSLKEYFYNIFINFENAYNSLDYNTMKRLTTSQIYHNYYTGIKLDLEKGRKRIINDIEKKKIILFEIDSTIAKQVASLMIEVEYINYTTDRNGNVVSGSRNKVNEKFEVTYIKRFDQEDIKKCKNCGAEAVGNICEYCRTPIRDEEFKISSIKKIIED